MTALAIEITDASLGKMAEDVEVQIRKIVDDEWQDLPAATTDSKGMATLCEGEEIESGGYFEVLVFLGAHFDRTGRDLPQYKMVDIVPLRFGIEKATSNITLRMSVSPYGYSADFTTAIKRIALV